MEQKQYKRQDRSVPELTKLKISHSLKQFNTNHPRGKASDGSEWSQKISDGLRNKYWVNIPSKKSDGERIADGDII